MMRASKSQIEHIASMQRELGDDVDRTELRKMYTPEASRLIDALLARVRPQ